MRFLPKPSIIEKDRGKKGNDYYQTIVKYVSKIKAPGGTTAEKVQNIWDLGYLKWDKLAVVNLK